MSRERKRIEADRALLSEAGLVLSLHNPLPLFYPGPPAQKRIEIEGPPPPERRRERRG